MASRPNSRSPTLGLQMSRSRRPLGVAVGFLNGRLKLRFEFGTERSSTSLLTARHDKALPSRTEGCAQLRSSHHPNGIRPSASKPPRCGHHAATSPHHFRRGSSSQAPAAPLDPTRRSCIHRTTSISTMQRSAALSAERRALSGRAIAVAVSPAHARGGGAKSREPALGLRGELDLDRDPVVANQPDEVGPPSCRPLMR